MVRRRFPFLPPIVGSYRLCSRRHASNGFFRVGDNVNRFITRQSHERCMHLLQHELQVLQSSVRIRVRR